MTCLSYPSNQTNITIPTLGTASAYPITFTVSGVVTDITDVKVSLSGYSHTFPGDVGMLLVAPDNTSYSLLTGRAGGSNDALNVNVNLTSYDATVWNGFSAGTFKNNTTVTNAMAFSAPAPVQFTSG